jgi:hypothetical protein
VARTRDARQAAAQLDHVHLQDPLADKVAALEQEIEELERQVDERRKPANPK